MKKLIITILAGIMSVSYIYGQEEPFRCATPEMNRRVLEKDPAARERRAELARFLENFEEPVERDEQVYIIPVVFHVVHNYGDENISYEQIEDAVRIMTNDYRLQNADTSMIIDEFKSLATDSRIEFRLAKIDPWGNCTNGVTRTVSYETNNGGEHIKDIAPSWPRAQYLNIWVVRSIPGSVAGYSYYPGTVGDGQDGILITHSYVGNTGTGSVNRSRTLTHEAGHYLNLAHPWGSTNDPGVPSNCDIDDGIEDTPLTIGHTSCNLYAVTCGSLDNVQNYMDYSYCSRMFTHGQGEMMRGVLNSSVGERNQLWQESNLIATGVLNPDEAEICAPIADFSHDVYSGCEGFAVQYRDLTYHTDSITSWAWSFPGGTPAVSGEKNPMVTYQSAGVYDASLTVTNPADNSSKSISQAIRVYPPEAGFSLPYTDDLESGTFPQAGNFTGGDYFFVTEGVNGWEYTENAALSGTHSLMADLRYEPEGIGNSVITPAILVDSTDFPMKIRFHYAYSQREASDMDILKIYVSRNCGESWILQFYKSGTTLQTAGNLHPFSSFVPDADEWEEDEFDINEDLFKYADNLRFRFEAISKGGNKIYIDDINLQQYNGIADNDLSDKLDIYPNPAENELYLISTLPENTEARATLYDISGRQISSMATRLSHKTDLSALLPGNGSGIFILKITSRDKTVIKRFVKKQRD